MGIWKFDTITTRPTRYIVSGIAYPVNKQTLILDTNYLNIPVRPCQTLSHFSDLILDMVRHMLRQIQIHEHAETLFIIDYRIKMV